MNDPQHNPWKINGQQVMYDNAWIRVTEYDVINPAGGKGIYGKVHFKGTAVGVIALDEENRIVLVGQYRFVLDAYSWEIPEGGSPLGADPLENCQRELMEETGLKAANWKSLLTMHLSNSVSDEFAIVYLATGLTQYAASPEDTEELVVKRVPLDEAFEMVEKGGITDSMSVAAIIKLRLLFAEGHLK